MNRKKLAAEDYPRQPAGDPHPPAPSPKAPPHHSYAPGEGEDYWAVPPHLRERMKAAARDLSSKATKSEALLWEGLRNRGLGGRKFRRQQAFGPFIVDFYCAAERLVIEVDGSAHHGQERRDKERQEVLESLGLRVVRLTAEEVEKDVTGSLLKLERILLADPPPLPGRGSGAEGSWERGPGGEGTATGTNLIQPI